MNEHTKAAESADLSTRALLRSQRMQKYLARLPESERKKTLFWLTHPSYKGSYQEAWDRFGMALTAGELHYRTDSEMLDAGLEPETGFPLAKYLKLRAQGWNPSETPEKYMTPEHRGALMKHDAELRAAMDRNALARKASQPSV